jgi:hypothetical protein
LLLTSYIKLAGLGAHQPIGGVPALPTWPNKLGRSPVQGS